MQHTHAALPSAWWQQVGGCVVNAAAMPVGGGGRHVRGRVELKQGAAAMNGREERSSIVRGVQGQDQNAARRNAQTLVKRANSSNELVPIRPHAPKMLKTSACLGTNVSPTEVSSSSKG